MKIVGALVLILGLAASIPALASDGEIGLFGPDGIQCHVTIPCGETRTLYVYALLEGASAGGITGVEFGTRIGGDEQPDVGWTFEESFAPNTTISLGIGSFNPGDESPQPPPYRGRGVNVAWQSCQTTDKVLIETVQVTNSGCNDHELHVVVANHDRSSNAFYQCPLFVLCDAPIYTMVCLGDNLTACRNPDPPYPDNAVCSTSGECIINPRSGPNGPSPCRVTAIEPRAWSGVKAMYR